MPIFLLFVFIALVLILLLLLFSWRQTPHGRLDTMPAVILRLLPEREDNLSVEEQRQNLRKLANLAGGRKRNVARIEDFSIPGPAGAIPVRLYDPAPEETLPLILYYHGGGWRSGDLESHDKICRRVARICSSRVLSVGYRRTPEHRFPAALDDAYTALQWACQQSSTLDFDPQRLIVMGDSAGGNLAAAVALRSRDEQGPPIRFQVLIYPVLDLANTERPSYLDFSEGYLLTRRRMQGFIADYVPDEQMRARPYASPLYCDNPEGLPPAIIFTAGFDPLRDEGGAYAKKLEAAGVPVHYHCYEGLIHGFFGLPFFGPKSTRAIRNIDYILKREV